jgi:hypothetical protein
MVALYVGWRLLRRVRLLLLAGAIAAVITVAHGRPTSARRSPGTAASGEPSVASNTSCNADSNATSDLPTDQPTTR